MKTLPIVVLMLLGALFYQIPAHARQPNIVIIFADDLGYGDLACFGHSTIATPHLDKMANDGMRFTQFYVAASVCTPSRAGLITGRLPIRNGMCSDKRRVLFPNSGGGIPQTEITMAEALKELGYSTACFGKWHLGHLPKFLPTNNGFDQYFGIPYSNDMDKLNSKDIPKGRAVFWKPKYKYWNLPLMKDTEVYEQPADQRTITKRYTEQAVKFIKEHKDQPFFVYLPHNLPHIPLFRSKEYEGKSLRGLYGDVVEEIDGSVGTIINTLKEQKIDEHTLVVFTSDNGPWLVFNDHGGSAGLLKDGKGCTWEGGMRVPAVMHWTGKIKPGQVCREIASTLDLLPTAVSLAGGKLKQDRIYDGYDLSGLLTGGEKSPREEMFYYRGTKLMAVRYKEFKAHFKTQSAYGPDSKKITDHNPPLLFNLNVDPSEKWNVAKDHPEVLEAINKLVKEHQSKLEIPASQLEIPIAR